MNNIEKLRYYEDLDAQKRLVILPCALGTEVYSVWGDCPRGYKEEYCKASPLSCDECPFKEFYVHSFLFSLWELVHPKKFFLEKSDAEELAKELNLKSKNERKKYE